MIIEIYNEFDARLCLIRYMRASKRILASKKILRRENFFSRKLIFLAWLQLLYNKVLKRRGYDAIDTIITRPSSP